MESQTPAHQRALWLDEAAGETGRGCSREGAAPGDAVAGGSISGHSVPTEPSSGREGEQLSFNRILSRSSGMKLVLLVCVPRPWLTPWIQVLSLGQMSLRLWEKVLRGSGTD